MSYICEVRSIGPIILLVLCQITGRLHDNSLIFPFWRLTRLTNKPALSFSLPEAPDGVGDVGVHQVPVDAQQAGEPGLLAAAPEGALAAGHGARRVVAAEARLNRQHFGLNFSLKKRLLFGSNFSTLRRLRKMNSLHMSQGCSSHFQAETQA